MSAGVGPVRPVIMCGGSGTRLWPASREAFPKQFAPLLGDRSTFQDTMLRVSEPGLFGKPLIVTNKAHRFMVERQLAEIGVGADILLEPVARDSGPAILAASLFVAEHSPEALVLILAADHMVRNVPAFRASVADGVAAARAGRIVTFGIVPDSPATGYGYIEPGVPAEGAARQVARFVEKPDAATAQRYIEAGYFWNSGNFLFRPDVMIGEYRAHDEAAVQAVQAALAAARTDLGIPVLAPEPFTAAPKISIDYAVMEKTANAAVVAGDFGWSDIGGWDALWSVSPKDEAGNVRQGEVLTIDARENFVSSEGQLVALIGVTNTVVVATRDAILVADKARTAEVKTLVDTLKKTGRTEAVRHSRVYRPWGWYRTTESGPQFLVHRVVVYPGERLSLQKHLHRAEHCVIVKGTARILLDGVARELAENESIDIPRGAVHRIENPGKIDLEIIEVQTGSYLGEDDIERIDDDYNRA